MINLLWVLLRHKPHQRIAIAAAFLKVNKVASEIKVFIEEIEEIEEPELLSRLFQIDTSRLLLSQKPTILAKSRKDHHIRALFFPFYSRPFQPQKDQSLFKYPKR